MDEILLNQKLKELEELKTELKNMIGAAGSLIKYGAVCYTQIKKANYADGIFEIRYPYPALPNNGLLFLIPLFSSVKYEIGNYNKLRLRYPQTKTDGTTSYTGVKEYNMVKEISNGTLSPVTRNDIIANRLAIFRFISGDDNTIILVNNPLYNELSCSSLYVTSQVTFGATPTIIKEDLTKTQLATVEQMLKLENRIDALENKFIYGTEDAEDVLYDAPEGTIYIKVEEV